MVLLAVPAAKASTVRYLRMGAGSTLEAGREGGHTPATYAVRKWTPWRSRLPRARS
jgi:hypothetical protein